MGLSMNEACPMIVTAEAPMSQRMVEKGEAKIPRTMETPKRVVYSCELVALIGPVKSISIQALAAVIEGAHTNLQVCSSEPPNTPHAADHQHDDEEQQGVRQERVDAEQRKHDGVVAGKVRDVVSNTALDLSKVLGLRHALKVKELAQRPEVRKAIGKGHLLAILLRLGHRSSAAGRGTCSEAVPVEPVGQDAYGEVDLRHGCSVVVVGLGEHSERRVEDGGGESESRGAGHGLRKRDGGSGVMLR